MARGSPVVFRGFSGGLNTQAAPYELGPGESPDCLNVRGTLRGAVGKREGMLDLSDGTNLATQPRKIGVYRGPAGLTKVVALGTRLQALEPGGPPETEFTPTTTSPWLWDTAIGQPIDGQGPLFLMSDVDKLYFNGTTFTAWTPETGSTIPAGRVMCAHMNRLYVADISSIADKRSYMAFSDIGNYRKWPAEQIVGFDPFLQDRVTAMCSLGPYLMVFKRDGIWRVYDQDTGANSKITSQAGTVFRDSVVATDRGAIFLDPDRGVMITEGQDVKAISDQILPELRNLPLNEEGTYGVCAAYLDGSYFLSIPDANGEPLYLLEYDLDQKAWWRHDCGAYALATVAFAQSADPLLAREALVAAVPGPLLQRLGVTDTSSTFRLMQLLRTHTWGDQVRGRDASPIAYRWRSAPATLDGDPQMGKRLAGLRVDSNGGGTVFQLRDFPAIPEPVGSLDSISGAEDGFWGVPRPGVWGTSRPPALWGGSSTIAQSQFHTLGTARTVQVQVQGLSASEFALHSYAWFIGPRPRTN